MDASTSSSSGYGWLPAGRCWSSTTRPTQPRFAELLPEGESGQVLITSRAYADWRSIGARPLALDVSERKESRALLRTRTGQQQTDALDELADALGDLPLALEQAAAYINAKAMMFHTRLAADAEALSRHLSQAVETAALREYGALQPHRPGLTQPRRV